MMSFIAVCTLHIYRIHAFSSLHANRLKVLNVDRCCRRQCPAWHHVMRRTTGVRATTTNKTGEDFPQFSSHPRFPSLLYYHSQSPLS